MPLLKRNIFTACATGLVLIAGAAHADSLDDNKVVVDKNGRVIMGDKFKNCVRTKWEEGTNPCGVEPAPAPKLVEKHVRTLEQAEKIVYFNFDSAALTPEAQARLDTIASALKRADDVQSASIVGYADQMGDSTYNIELSKRRAATVQSYLHSRGYLNTQMAKIRGLGETDSVTNCSDVANRESKIACLSADRRVEVEINYVETETTTTYE